MVWERFVIFSGVARLYPRQNDALVLRDYRIERMGERKEKLRKKERKTELACIYTNLTTNQSC